MLSLSKLEDVLVTTYRGMKAPIWSESEARELARMVYEDMTAAKFDLELTQWPPVRLSGAVPVHVPAYKLNGSDYGPSKFQGANQTYKATGPMLDGGHLPRLARACKLAREHLKGRWPSSYAKRLRDPKDHPAVIEELLWLGRWIGPSGVKGGVRLIPGSSKDVDWTFDICQVRINLEVKFRRRDWIARVDGPSFSRNFDSYFDNALQKFTSSKEGELNLLGITTFAQPDRGLRECTCRFLRAHPEFDGILFWSLHAPDGKSVEVHSTRNKPLIEH